MLCILDKNFSPEIEVFDQKSGQAFWISIIIILRGKVELFSHSILFRSVGHINSESIVFDNGDIWVIRFSYIFIISGLFAAKARHNGTENGQISVMKYR